MADIDLPVFSFNPNWRTGVTETLEWMTDVLRSPLGYEQRRSLRLTPRRFFQARFNPINNARSFMDLWMQRFADQEFLLPLWHDRAQLTAQATSGTARLTFDNTYREFETGGTALLRIDEFTHEKVEIAAQDDTGLDLVSNLSATWAVGASVYPLRPAYLDQPSGQLASLTRTVGEIQLGFRCSRHNPYDAGAETLSVYSGYPVMVLEPNRAEDLNVEYERLSEDADFALGRLFRRDEAGRAFQTQFYNWQAVGRLQHHQLRQALYRLNGRQKAAWMPSFNRDIKLSRNITAASANVDIEKIGYTYLGGPVSGRNFVSILDDTGTRRVVQIASTGAPADPDVEERLVLSAVAGFNAAAGREASFLEVMRLDQDAVEIVHHTDSDGVCEVGAAFKAFRDGRTSTGLLVVPYDTWEEPLGGALPCGAPAVDEASDCYNADPVYTFEGWYYEFIWQWDQLGDGYPTGADTLLTTHPGNILKLSVLANGFGGAGPEHSKGTRSAGAGKRENWFRTSAWLPSGNYTVTVDPRQDIGPSDAKNNARWTIKGRPWYAGHTTFMAAWDTTSGFQTESDPFFLPDYAI